MLQQPVGIDSADVFVMLSHADGKHTARGRSFPSLIEATLEDISKGLEAGVFTSVELVAVGPPLAISGLVNPY